MIGLYLAQDSFGTACNVTGDGAIAMFIDGVRDRVSGAA
jgi:Na+/H+-dicarboxylate symporter